MELDGRNENGNREKRTFHPNSHHCRPSVLCRILRSCGVLPPFAGKKTKTQSLENPARNVLIDNMLTLNPTKSHHEKIKPHRPFNSKLHDSKTGKPKRCTENKMRPPFTSDLTYLTVKLSLLLSAP
jgi:hypothetical protein